MEQATNIQLMKKIFITGKIQLLTGLRIGGSSSSMSIGGLDNIIIRNPINNKPYIPGSSLKGKMRSLIELRDGTIGHKNMGAVEHGPSDATDSLSCRLFGNSAGNNQQQPSRIIVRDCELLTPEEKFSNTDLPYAEIKTEVVIDRITSAAGPRIMERVPAGAEFSLNLVINIFHTTAAGASLTDPEKEFVQATFDALTLLQDDYLGGSGSRGYGQVKFNIESITQRSRDYYIGKTADEPYTLIPVPDHLRAVEQKK
ncbi:MAG: type III-A CRISPR-associated RAMP protein Csm3 [Cyclobacteriaceae bacterium]|nr:type III-A CRISPR-associated RAMP protein Csm3 [Cyclobacteriaceae bacterium]